MIGLLRVKNEARWIKRCIESILPVCDNVLVLDDHSKDGTAEICEGIPGVRAMRSPFSGLDEARDKNLLLEEARKLNADPVLMIDGDEILTSDSIPTIQLAARSGGQCFSLRVLFAWDREDQIRADGVYRDFRRPSLFRPGNHSFKSTQAEGNFHCGNAPVALHPISHSINASLLHLGYLHKEDRIRKYEWYRSIDGKNPDEDGYRHIAQGDLPELPATAKFKWAGPLELKSLR